HSVIGNSMITVAIDEGLRSYYDRYVACTIPKSEPTSAMDLGTLLHAMVLEPTRIPFAAAPECDRRTNAGKAAWAAFEADCIAAGKRAIKSDAWQCAETMLSALREHELARTLLWETQGINEAP